MEVTPTNRRPANGGSVHGVAVPSESLVTLCVDVFVYDENDNLRVLPVPEGSYDLAGFESWRQEVWGSAATIALGAHFLPQLDGSDLYVQPDEVDAFAAECALL